MRHWLLKTEPGDYSYHDLEKAGLDIWDGVRNFSAQRNIGTMQPGDLAFIYHTGKEKSIIGVAEIASMPYPDPQDQKFIAMDVSPKYRLHRPITLAEIKANHEFPEWELVRLPRLSVMPVPPEHWERIHEISEM